MQVSGYKKSTGLFYWRDKTERFGWHNFYTSAIEKQKIMFSNRNNKKRPYDKQAEELGDPRPQPQVSADDFSDEPLPHNPPPEKPVSEDNDKQAG